MNEFLTQNWQTIIAIIVTPIVTWLFSKRHFQKLELQKEQASLTGTNLGNVTANFEVYQNLINDLEERFKSRINELEEDLDKMKVLNDELRKAVARQERYINKLQIKLDSYEKLED